MCNNIYYIIYILLTCSILEEYSSLITDRNELLAVYGTNKTDAGSFTIGYDTIEWRLTSKLYNINIYPCINRCINIYIFIYTYINICIHLLIYKNTSIYIYRYVHMYI